MRYRQNGKNKLFDPIRKILVPDTPEERVRQRILTQMKKRGYPENLLCTEKPLRHHNSKTLKRADIVCYKTENKKTPLIIFEVKEPENTATNQTLEQVMRYRKEIGKPYSPFVGITRAGKLMMYDVRHGQPKELKGTYTFRHLLQRTSLRYQKPSLPKRYTITYLRQERYHRKLRKEGTLGSENPRELRIFIAELNNFFRAEKHLNRYLPRRFGDFMIREDKGISERKYGNASGGSFTGQYRSFLVRDKNENDQILRVALFENNVSHKTILMVTIDDRDGIAHPSLEMRIIPEYARISEDKNKIHIIHDGTMTIGNRGSVKREEVIRFIKKNSKNLIKDGQVDLGSLPYNKSISKKEILPFLLRVFEYALIRDIFRKDYRNKSK